MSGEIWWIDPTTGDAAESTTEDFLVDYYSFITCPGPDLTVIGSGYQTWSIWGTIALLKKFSPLRLAQRDDGNGVTERSSRIRTAGKEMSSSDDSNRLSQQGRGLYR